MMQEDSIFGAEPDDLKRLVRFGLEPEDKVVEEDKSPQTASVDELMERPGVQIGRYKLLRVLGEGGMGIVYLAQQNKPVARQVALKVIKPGMDSERVIARFEAEEQALALMDHPHVARVYDADLTGSGRPYFVMEYVKGIPITEYCDKYKLTIEERLNLFLQVCHAVHHAHQKGIIHRDIKPSNILVYTDGDKAVPKIIDFGIAKALSQPLTERTLATEESRLLGTPEYMSPEQAGMAVEDIDTRSDIYSLGVLLYVLLTGVLPFDSDILREGGIDDIRKVIRETDPKTPSNRLTKLGEAGNRIAESRRTKIETLARRLRRELEWIPIKAMCKRRSERYRSASELADDVENYLKGNPLIAGPPSTVYRLNKLVRRNVALSFSLLTAIITLVIGLIATTAMYVQADHARAEAQAVSDLLQKSITSSLNLRQVTGKEITVRSILDAISKNLEVGFQDQPLFGVSIQNELISAYGVLGLYEQAELHAKRAIEIRRTLLGTENIATIHSMYQLGWLYLLQSRYSEAESLLTKALTSFKVALDEEHPDRLWCMAFLGWVYNYQHRFPEAEELFKDGLDAAQRTRDPEPVAPFLMYSWAFAQWMQARYREAERMYLRGLEISRHMRGELHDDTLFLMWGLGALYLDMGRYDEAEEFLQAALKIRREVWSEEHPSTLQIMTDLGWLYHSQGQYDQAESLLVKALGMGRRTKGEAHICSLLSMHGLGTLYLSQGRYDEAEPLLDKALKIGERILGEENWATLRIMNTLAKLYMAQGRYDEAEKTFRHVLEARKRIWNDNHPDILETMNDMAVLYKEQGRYDDAEQLLLEAAKGRRLKLGDTHPYTLESWNHLIALYEAWNKPKKAEEWRTKLQQKEEANK